MARKSRKVAEQPKPKATRKKTVSWQCGVYVRLSHEDNDYGAGTIDTQIEIVQNAIAALPDVKVKKVYQDNGHTGTNFERPAFQEMLDDVKSAKINCIAVKDLSRFGRNYLDAGILIERILPHLNVRFISVNDNIDTLDEQSDTSRMIIPVKNLVNEMYSRDISRKIHNANMAHMEDGTFTLSIAPYGYMRNPDDLTRFIVDDKKAPVIRFIFEEALKGTGFSKIAKKLTGLEYSTPGMVIQAGGDWSEKPASFYKWSWQSVVKIATNPAYIGDLVLNKTDQSVFSQKPTRKDASEHIVIHNAHEPIVSNEDFEKVQLAYQANSKAAKRNQQRTKRIRDAMPNLFGEGILRCGACGSRMALERNIHADDTVRAPIYACCAHRQQIECKNTATIAEPYVAMMVADAIRAQLSLHAAFANAKEGASQLQQKSDAAIQALSSRKRMIEAELAHTNEMRRGLYERYSEGELDKSSWQEQKEAYDEQARKLAANLSELDQKIDVLAATKKPSSALSTTLSALGTSPDLTPELVAALVKQVDVMPDRSVQVTFKFDDYGKKLETLKEMGI